VALPHAGAGNLGIHRSVFLAVGGFDPAVRYLQDTDLCWRIQLAGHELVFVPDLVVHVRLRSTIRGMYRQGHNFGAWQADLERRYADAARELAARELAARRAGGIRVSPQAGQDDVATAPTSGNPLTHTVRRAGRLAGWVLRNRVSLGGQVWQLGWHLGHREARPAGQSAGPR
jgi:Predicted glycosyltransferases